MFPPIKLIYVWYCNKHGRGCENFIFGVRNFASLATMGSAPYRYLSSLTRDLLKNISDCLTKSDCSARMVVKQFEHLLCTCRCKMHSNCIEILCSRQPSVVGTCPCSNHIMNVRVLEWRLKIGAYHLKARFILPANVSCEANFIASQRERARVPIVASPNFASHSQEVWTRLKTPHPETDALKDDFLATRWRQIYQVPSIWGGGCGLCNTILERNSCAQFHNVTFPEDLRFADHGFYWP